MVFQCHSKYFITLVVTGLLSKPQLVDTRPFAITLVVTGSVVLLQFCDIRFVSFILGANCNVYPLIFYVVYSPMVHKQKKVKNV
jgi:hypothetical protein